MGGEACRRREKSSSDTIDDLGPNYTNMRVCTFKAQALLRDGQQFEVAENFVTF